MAYSATITSKGQITIPRAARQALNSSTVDIEVQGNLVILRPVPVLWLRINVALKPLK